MTVLDVIQRSTEFLANKGVESPRLQVELLLAEVLKVPRLRLYLDFERKLAEEDLGVLRALVKRRGNREPLQHLIGTSAFCGLEIKVSPEVLIPRPETELLAERAWEFLNGRPQTPVPDAFLDFGTGSGCLAIAIASHCPTIKGVALDNSEKALVMACENAARLKVLERIEFVHSDGFQNLAKSLSFSLIVSNPPYIPSAEISALMPEVRDYDPKSALDGGEDGLLFYRLLAKEAPRFLRPDGRLMIEFGDGQEESIQEILIGEGWKIDASLKDYTGRFRILIAGRPES